VRCTGHVRGRTAGAQCDLYQRPRVNHCNGHLPQRGTMQQNAASLNQRRSSCFARSASLSSPPPLSALPLSPRPRHRPGDAAAGSAATMADFMRDGAIAVSATATAAARAGAISIRPAASDRSQHRDDARLLRRGRVFYTGTGPRGGAGGRPGREVLGTPDVEVRSGVPRFSN
jgi:hypothetical protein